MSPYKTPISVLVVIYRYALSDSEHPSKLEILLLERADVAGAWQSVTGSMEANESLSETAAREVFEETGIIASEHFLRDWQQQNYYEIYPRWRHRYAPDVTHNTEHVFALQLNNAQPNIGNQPPIILSPREHVRYEWLTWHDAALKVFSPSNRAAILQLGQQSH
ncbi:MAG: dihydroneopterin triphosphate diphosphatase [Gallionella sp.]